MEKHGGDRIAEALKAQGVKNLFTLCGGHISPILVGAKKLGIGIIAVRHEAAAVFAADVTSRLTGVPGVAAVTAGPGLTNTITAVKNAQLAQSPLILFGGATATALRGRGALQDIDQLALMQPHVKAALQVERVRDLATAVEDGFEIARSGTPGPVFIETPVDLLYYEEIVREWYGAKAPKRSLGEKAVAWYLRRHVDDLFAGVDGDEPNGPAEGRYPIYSEFQVAKAAAYLRESERPVLVIGSQTLLEAEKAEVIAAAVERMEIPVYLSGMARGLLGRDHPLQKRHKRRAALKEADLVLLAGVPADFRLDYGGHIPRKAKVIAVNRRSADLYLNQMPTLAVQSDAGAFLLALAENAEPQKREDWHGALNKRDQEREKEIAEMASQSAGEGVNPIAICKAIEDVIDDDSILIADGGDFVGTAAYTLKPRGPLSWLDPGVFGTLGVGGGFAAGAKTARPDSEVWILYGDGSLGYSLSEFDTYHRHGLGVIAVVGNDASWQQIARDQEELLGDLVGTELVRSDYHLSAEALGAKGFVIRTIEEAPAILQEAKALAKQGKSVLLNVHLAKSDFRKGSISI